MAIVKDMWYEVNEASREYYFANGAVMRFENVARFKVSPNHTHFLESLNGSKAVVRNTWVSILIDGKWIDGEQ